MSAPLGMGGRQAGVGIIEVLIALVVVSLGVLGIAGMQLTGMQHGSGSLNRAKAVVFAEDMAERLRINAVPGLGVRSTLYDGRDIDAFDGFCAVEPARYCDASDGAAANDCDVDQLAAFDLKTVACGSWVGAQAGQGVVNGALPAGRLVVDCLDSPCTADSTWSVIVGWSEGSTTSDDADDVHVRQVGMRLRP